MHVDRVVCHRQVANAHANLVSLIHDQRINVGENPAVPCPQVEIRHRHDARHICSRINIKGVQHDQEITINWHERWVLGVNNEHTHHTHSHLGHLVSVRVIHESTRLDQIELIDECFAGFDAGMAKANHTVHARRQY